MRRLFLLLPLLLVATASAQVTRKIIPIRIETTLGIIDAELDSARAPITVTNFLRYVDTHRFDGGSFFRAVTMSNQEGNPVKIEVIQSQRSRSAGSPDSPIMLERTTVTGLHHLDGTLSMARGASPNSASDQFFICIGPQAELDFGGKRNADGQGFAAFGQVTRGMSIVKEIQTQPLQTALGQGQYLVTPVAIIKISRR